MGPVLWRVRLAGLIVSVPATGSRQTSDQNGEPYVTLTELRCCETCWSQDLLRQTGIAKMRSIAETQYEPRNPAAVAPKPQSCSPHPHPLTRSSQDPMAGYLEPWRRPGRHQACSERQ